MTWGVEGRDFEIGSVMGEVANLWENDFKLRSVVLNTTQWFQ